MTRANEISPKVLRPACALALAGAASAVAGAALDDDRLRAAAVGVLGGATLALAMGWYATDPLREPYIEPGFWEPDPEPEEHREAGRQPA